MKSLKRRFSRRNSSQSSSHAESLRPHYGNNHAKTCAARGDQQPTTTQATTGLGTVGPTTTPEGTLQPLTQEPLAEAVQLDSSSQQPPIRGQLRASGEIRMREASADLSSRLFEITHDTRRLCDAIRHYQAIIRLLKSPSALRARYLDKLAYLEMSAFRMTESLQTLDDSIAHSKQARDEAVPTNDSWLATIYHNLGYSISARGIYTGNDTNMDEAIDCGRKVLQLTEPTSDIYQMATVNLASRLQNRYSSDGRETDVVEAMSLLDQQMRQFPPGTRQHQSALLVKGKMMYEKSKVTENIRDVDQAIELTKQGLATLTKTHEQYTEVLLLVATLHHMRFKHSGQLTDLALAQGFSRQMLDSVPQTYHVRPKHVAHYLRDLHDHVCAADSRDLTRAAIQEAKLLLDEVPRTHLERHSVNMLLGGILSKQYMLTADVSELREVFRHARSSVEEYNEHLDVTQPNIPYDPFFDLVCWLGIIDSAPKESPARQQAVERLLALYTPVHESKQLLHGILSMYQEHELELQAFVENIDTDERLSDEQLSKTVIMLQARREENTRADQQRISAARNFRRDDYVDPIFGTRHLAIDPNTKRIVVSMEGLVKDILGYDKDEKEPQSWTEYEAREARLERESFEKAQKEGSHPNPSLCRMCRKAKPLMPAEFGGWTWNKKMWIPVGTHSQLLTRKHCSICRLILSLIGIEGTNDLHPRLAQIDREIQGTQFHIQRLSSSELMLGVEYGMVNVGALRLLNQNNMPSALRQKPINSFQDTAKEPEGRASENVTKGDQVVDFKLLRKWINICQIDHGELCNSLGKSKRYATDIPLFLVDVRDQCLVIATSSERYFTLSYVWDNVDMSRTLKENVGGRLQKKGLDPDQFPKTIRDALHFVKSIGERYLWIDALCIVQDNEEQKSRDIPRMDIVYRKACANLVALAGADANVGLPGVSPDSRLPQQVEIFHVATGSADLALQEDTPGANDKISLVATPTPLSFAQESSHWNTRGWILQEQMLARRNIYFSPNYVYFKCNEQGSERCEVTLGGKCESYWGKDDDNSCEGTTIVHNNPLTELRLIVDVDKVERTRRVFSAYSSLVEMYTTRKLTHSSDILNAFSGMLSAFHEEFDSHSLHGLPIAALDLALLWTPVSRLSVRKSSKSSSPASSASSAKSKTDFPTWSWAGWIGRIDYRLLPLDKELPPESLIGEFFLTQQNSVFRVKGYERSCSDPKSKATEAEIAALYELMRPLPSHGEPGQVLSMIASAVFGKSFSVDRKREPDYLSSSRHIHTQTTQAVVRLHDKQGKHCGLLFEHCDYYSMLPQVEAKWKAGLEQLQDLTDKAFVAISQAKNAYKERKGLTRVEGDVKLFDAHEYQAHGPGSALVNVLLLRLGVGNTFERIGVGQIHIKAWEDAAPQRSWIRIV